MGRPHPRIFREEASRIKKAREEGDRRCATEMMMEAPVDNAVHPCTESDTQSMNYYAAPEGPEEKKHARSVFYCYDYVLKAAALQVSPIIVA